MADGAEAGRTLSQSLADFEIVEAEDGMDAPIAKPGDELDGGERAPEADAVLTDDEDEKEPLPVEPPQPKEAEAAALPTKASPPLDLGEFAQDLALYTNPVRSAVVFAKLLTLYVMLACDLGVTLLFIKAQIVLYVTVFLLMMAVVKYSIDKYFHKIAAPKMLPQQILEPLFAEAADMLGPLLLSEEAAVGAVRAVYAALPAAQAQTRSVLYCTSFAKTGKVIVLSYAAGLVAWWLSISTLVLFALVGFFTVPIAYTTHQADVDHALDIAKGHAQSALASLPPAVQEYVPSFETAPKAKAE